MSTPLINAERKLKQGKLADAHKLLSQVLKRELENRQAQYLLGETLQQQNRTDESLAYLKKALADNQAEPCWYVMYGVALEKKGQYNNAERSYRLAEDFEQYIDIALNLAEDKENLGRLRKDLRQEVQNSSLMDDQQLAEDIESALLTGWKTLCKETGTDHNNNSK
jgi:tetratricopeptide (TPR) repeat protein